MIVIFGGVMGALAYTSLVERRVMAFVQMRPGPNRVGPFGLLQPIADGLKFLFKEQTVPGNANVLLYYARAPRLDDSGAAFVLGDSLWTRSENRRTSTSACCSSSLSRRSAFTGSCWEDGHPIPNIR